jgi:hypothetical protein
LKYGTNEDMGPMCIMAILLQVRYNERFYVYMDNHGLKIL